MKTGLTKKVLGFLIALTSSDGKTPVYLGITIHNSGSETFENASISFRGPLTPADISSASVSLGILATATLNVNSTGGAL